jgi:hypothetical protein
LAFFVKCTLHDQLACGVSAFMPHQYVTFTNRAGLYLTYSYDVKDLLFLKSEVFAIFYINQSLRLSTAYLRAFVMVCSETSAAAG